jgi:endonuclease G
MKEYICGRFSKLFQRAAAAITLLAMLVTFFLVTPLYADTGTGAVSLTAPGTAVTENFDTLANTAGSTTNSALPAGWYITETGGGARDNEQYGVDTGGSNTGDIYSYGTAGSTDRALGSLRSGTLIPVFGAKFTNNTGTTISSLDISYTGEEWRLGTAARADRIDFQISTDATDLSTGTYTDVDTLDFSTPNTTTIGSKDGNSAINRTVITNSISGLSIASGASFFIRWTDSDASGADDGLSIDDFSITPQGGAPVDNAPTIANTVPADNVTGVATDANVSVTFSEPVTATGSSFQISCATSGAHPFALSGGATIYTLNPTVNFTPGEVCTVTVFAAQVADQDGTSNNMAADYVFDFTVADLSPTNPSGTGTATPSTMQAGSSTLLRVTVTPGANPASTSITVTGDLSSIGGSATQQFFDDATNGDVTAGDNVFSYQTTVANNTAAGGKTLPVSIVDAQSRTGSASISLTVSSGTGTHLIPFSQDWSNTNLITVNDDWSGVPGIVGYRGDNLTPDTGTDPQTILADGSSTPINVLANQTNLDTATSGGLAELESGNPVVALQGSGTADAPHLVISVNTTGQNNITMSYNIRDVDGSADNSAQSVALQYRIGSTGNYTNIPAAFVADATTANQATQVTPVNVALPASVNNQPLVQIRIITTNAVGSDEWVGIDDISIISGGTIPLSGSGSASTAQVETGNSTLLKVSVNPATNPNSTGIAVTGNLTAIGGSATQQFFDDGTNGDQVAGDNVFSYLATVAANSSSGTRVLPVTISDAQSRTANASITLTVIVGADPSEHLVMGNPSNATIDVNNPFNYLLPKNQYVLSYHRDRAIPNWVSWHLDSTWLGSAPRQDDFRPDESLPAGWYRATQFSYSGSGFDRGHHTPSADRTRSIPDNSATFLMTNIMPQAPGNNQGPWEKLESFSRTLIGQGNELYIIAGGVGTGGTGDNGFATTVDNGRVAVPAQTWKVIMVLPAGDNDVARVNANTRTIAVLMPNDTSIRPEEWQKYLTTVDIIESVTGYDFFSNVDPAIQAQIESKIDSGTTVGPTAANVSVSGRVMTESGRGVKNVQITLTDSNGNMRTAQTTSFGYYRFDDVEAGETVVLAARAKGQRFVQSSMVRTVNEQISDADFTVINYGGRIR